MPPSPSTAASAEPLAIEKQLRAIIDTYRARHGELLTITALADHLDNLTTALEAVAAKVRRQEEELRTLTRRTANPPQRSQKHD